MDGWREGWMDGWMEAYVASSTYSGVQLGINDPCCCLAKETKQMEGSK